MPRHDLKTPGGRFLAYTKTDASGRTILYTTGGQPLGIYDPRADTTRTMGNTLVGYGELLTTLLRKVT